MDAQTLCLGALTCGDASGYEIKKMFEEGPFAYFHQVSFGSIYPSLAKLCEDGKISMREEAQEGRPDKKVYSLTERGRQALREALTVTPAADKMRSEVTVMLFLHEFLEPDHLRAVYEQQMGYYRCLLAHIEDMDCTDLPRERLFVRGLGMAIYRSLVEYMEQNAHMMLGEGSENENRQEYNNG